MSDSLFVKEDKIEWETENLSDRATNSVSYASKILKEYYILMLLEDYVQKLRF